MTPSEVIEVMREAMERIRTIRTLPLTDMNDTDEEIAEQYSSVIDGLVYKASEALKKANEIVGDE